MPTKKLVYTQGDIKELLSRIHRVPLENIKPSGDGILYQDYQGYKIEVDDDTFIFEVEK